MSEFADNSWAERLYDDMGAGLLLYGRALGLSPGEAEDVLHDCFAALLKLAEPPANARHYVLRAFRNRAANHRRSWWRRLARDLESRRWFEPPAPEDPRERAAMRALPQLPPVQREVIVLKLWHGLTFQAIGELLDLSPNTAAGRYRSGLERLRRAMENFDHESDRVTDPPNAWLETTPPCPGA